MKVLLVSLFHPELVRGGAQQVCYELFEGIKEHRPDIEVTLLASVDQSYPALFKSGARITGFDGRPDEFVFLTRDYDYWWHKVSNPLVLESFAEFLEDLNPDVVHFHHFLTLGVDLLTLTRKTLPDCKIVFTLHEFMSICAADGQMKRKTDGSTCTGASPVRCHQCFPEFGPEKFFMREQWLKAHLNVVDVFTTPSRFMIEHYVKWGLAREKIKHVSNGQKNYNIESLVDDLPAKETETGSRNRFGFFGQLVDNKGIYVIIEAVRLLRAEGFNDFIVEINGDNLRYASEKRRKEIEEFLEKESKRPAAKRNVVLNGSYHVSQLKYRMSRIDWVIVPSVWEETFCLVVSEAWMFKKPVIASRIGAMAERIQPGVNGLLFEVGDARSLAKTIKDVCTDSTLWESMEKKIEEPPSRKDMVESCISLYA